MAPRGVDVAHEEGQPAAVVGEVGEEARVVARTAERGDMCAALLVAAVGGTLVHHGVGGDSLELVELRGLQAVELFERDERHLGKLQSVVLAHASGKVLGGEVAAELGGQEVAHEGALVDALRTDVGEYLVVGLVGFEPRGHHGHEPLLEEAVVHLLRAARDVHHRCHLVDVVDAVPLGQALQILLQGVVLGIEVTLDDDVEVRDLSLTARVEAEAAVEGVDVLVGKLDKLRVER